MLLAQCAKRLLAFSSLVYPTTWPNAPKSSLTIIILVFNAMSIGMSKLCHSDHAWVHVKTKTKRRRDDGPLTTD
jgi:hypothetical protein